MFKFVWPVLWLGFIGSFLFGSLTGANPPRFGSGITPFWGNVMLSVLFAFGVFVTITGAVPMRRVDWDGRDMWVWNYFFSTRTVPLSQIARVRIYGDFSSKGRPVVRLFMRDRAQYGRRFDFIPEDEALLTEFLGSLEPGTEVRR
jgi:hypothetical protein